MIYARYIPLQFALNTFHSSKQSDIFHRGFRCPCLFHYRTNKLFLAAHIVFQSSFYFFSLSSLTTCHWSFDFVFLRGLQCRGMGIVCFARALPFEFSSVNSRTPNISCWQGYSTDIKTAARLLCIVEQSEIDVTSKHITANFSAGILHIILQTG